MLPQEREQQTSRIPVSSDFIKELNNKPSLQAKKEFAKTFTYTGLNTLMDWSTVLTTLNFGYGVMEDPNPQIARIGSRVISDIDSYLHEEGMVIKFVLPPLDNPRQAMQVATEEVEILRNRLAANPKLDEATPDAIRDLLHTVLPEITKGNPSEMRGLSVPFIVDLDQRDNDHVKALASYADVLRTPKAEGEVRSPEDTLKLLKDATHYRDPNLPDLYRQKNNGVSIEQLEREENPDRFSYNALKWISGLSTGNLLWLDTVNELFFADSDAIQPLYQSEEFPQAQKDFSTKTYSFQWWLTQKILLPLYDPKATDKTFDRMFSQILDSDHQDATLFLSRLIVKNFLLPPTKQWIRDSRYAIAEPDGYPCPMQHAAFVKGSQSELDLHVSMYTATLFRTLLSESNELSQMLEKRFGLTKQYENFVGAFNDAAIKNNPSQANTDGILAEINQLSGGKSADVIREVSDVFGTLYGNQNEYDIREFERRNYIEINFSFPQGVGIEKVGFESISFIPTYKDDGTAFLLKFGNGQVIGGKITDQISMNNVVFNNNPDLLKLIINALQFGYSAYQLFKQKRDAGEYIDEVEEKAVLEELTVYEELANVADRNEEGSSNSITRQESNKFMIDSVDPDEVLENLRKLLQEEVEKGREDI